MVTPIGMIPPLPDISLVMGTEVITILGAEMVIRPAVIVVVAIICAPLLIVGPGAILSGPVLCHGSTGE